MREPYRAKQKVKTEISAAGIKADALYAAFASYRERGDRSYWLLRTPSRTRCRRQGQSR